MGQGQAVHGAITSVPALGRWGSATEWRQHQGGAGEGVGLCGPGKDGSRQDSGTQALPRPLGSSPCRLGVPGHLGLGPVFPSSLGRPGRSPGQDDRGHLCSAGRKKGPVGISWKPQRWPLTPTLWWTQSLAQGAEGGALPQGQAPARGRRLGVGGRAVPLPILPGSPSPDRRPWPSAAGGSAGRVRNICTHMYGGPWGSRAPPGALSRLRAWGGRGGSGRPTPNRALGTAVI